MTTVVLTLISLYLAVSCLLKALSPGHLAGVIRGLVPVSPRVGAALAALVIGWEGCLAAGLLTLPALAVPATVATLAAFVLLLVRGSWQGAIDCGCHGPGVSVHPLAAAALDLGLLLALLAAWGHVPERPLSWGALPLGVLVLVAAACWVQADAMARGRVPPFDPSLSRPGRLLPPGTLDGVGEPPHAGQELLVALISPDCPLCQTWLKVLARIHERDDLPDVIAVSARRAVGAADAAPEHAAVPRRTVSRWRFARLALSVPSALRVVDGRVTERWLRALPDSLVDRLR